MHPVEDQTSPQDIINECQNQLAHAWVVRAFVRHSDEAEDFPELTEIGRAVLVVQPALFCLACPDFERTSFSPTW